MTTSSGFDPQKFIGRESEQELFEKLLKFETAAQILAISAPGGDGKSLLLKQFRQHCRTERLRPPHSLVTFKELADHSHLSLIKLIAEDLSRGGINFEQFEENERARMAGDFLAVTALANLQGSNFSGAQGIQAAGIIVNPGVVETMNISNVIVPLPPEQDNAAQDRSVRYFYEALHDYCATKPAVIMLDSYEECEASLKDWIERDFLEKNFFRATCESCLLGLVIAGQSIPDFYHLLPREQYESKIVLVNELGRWTRRNVEECLHAHGNQNETDVDAIYALIERGTPLLDVVTAIGIFSNNAKRQS